MSDKIIENQGAFYPTPTGYEPTPTSYDPNPSPIFNRFRSERINLSGPDRSPMISDRDTRGMINSSKAQLKQLRSGMKEGGVYDLTEAEIGLIMRAGGSVEYI